MAWPLFFLKEEGVKNKWKSELLKSQKSVRNHFK